jgi:hypothetical protein
MILLGSAKQRTIWIVGARMARPGSRGAGPGVNGATNLEGPGMPVYMIADADPSGLTEIRGNAELVTDGIRYLPHAADEAAVLRRLFHIDVD